MTNQGDVGAIFKEGIVIDGLVAGNHSEGLVNHLLACGMTAGNWTVAGHSDDLVSAAVRMEGSRWIVGRLPNKAFIVENAEDVDRAKREGGYGIILGFQGAEPLGHEFHLVAVFWRLGLRILGLTYNQRNLVGDGCLEPENRGLTHFGIQVVRDCNSLGILVDLTHAGEKTSLDAIEISTKPCVFSHSNPAATRSNPRNVTNGQMKAVAEKGGVTCLSAFSDFVGDTRGGRRPALNELTGQIEYAVDVVGIDHVGIGSDIHIGFGTAAWWDNNTKRRYPETTGGMTAETHNVLGYEDYKGVAQVAEGLLKRGYGPGDLRKILGGNLQRVLTAVLPRGTTS
jgi:membrane dipeptidase